MKIDYSQSFDSQYSELSKHQKQLVREALELFDHDPYSDILRNHPLKEEWSQYRSITADNDLRLHFRISNDGNRALFVAVGTHEELYN